MSDDYPNEWGVKSAPSDLKPAPCSGCGTTFGIHEGKCPGCWKASYDDEKARADAEHKVREVYERALVEIREALGLSSETEHEHLVERIAALEAENKRLLPSSLALENQMLRNTCQSLKDQLDEIGTATGASQAKRIAALEALLRQGMELGLFPDPSSAPNPERIAVLRLSQKVKEVLGDE